MQYDVLIVGAGAAGMSCALVLGSAYPKAYATDKTIGLIAHQKTSHLQSALFNNVLGLAPGTLGSKILNSGKEQLQSLYPHVDQIEKEKVKEIVPIANGWTVTTNKSSYTTREVVIAVGYTSLINIRGLASYIEPHPKAQTVKDRIWLKNTDHLVAPGLYAAGTIAGWRSQFAIAAGSGAQVATDVLTGWNNGTHSKVHDKVTE
ncbi:FAD-dependent oxidoreductase [Winogradskyella aurantiaca]|uniref:FAD-dependent oxidoreductase n=1 Tax=Winogradskyella aurantiaca TaxID=2219558 RepID=UPI000E1E0F1A|nr:FAD-dependent oxidoreductase [Winogradskyella aurantiaca]